MKFETMVLEVSTLAAHVEDINKWTHSVRECVNSNSKGMLAAFHCLFFRLNVVVSAIMNDDTIKNQVIQRCIQNNVNEMVGLVEKMKKGEFQGLEGLNSTLNVSGIKTQVVKGSDVPESKK